MLSSTVPLILPSKANDLGHSSHAPCRAIVPPAPWCTQDGYNRVNMHVHTHSLVTGLIIRDLLDTRINPAQLLQYLPSDSFHSLWGKMAFIVCHYCLPLGIFYPMSVPVFTNVLIPSPELVVRVNLFPNGCEGLFFP